MLCTRLRPTSTEQDRTAWRFISQPAHALLASKLVAPWSATDRPEPWSEFLHAVAQHDNGWHEWERDEWRVIDGRPINFHELEPSEVVAHVGRTLDRLGRQSRLGELLVAEHYRSLYHTDRDRSPIYDALIDRLEATIEHGCADLELPRARLDRYYAILRYGDTLSLLLSLDRIGTEPHDITTDGDGTPYRAILAPTGGNEVWIDPWPYASDAFDVTVDAKVISRSEFTSGEALREAYRACPAETVRWLIAPAG